MLNDKTVQATNFTCFHAGPMEGWAQYRLEPPNAPVQMQGKLFLRNLLGSAGLEMSLNVVPPGHGMPFLHKHRQNDEVYIVVGGRGQFLVDGECLLCLQYRADSVIQGGTLDGQKVEYKPAWPE